MLTIPSRQSSTCAERFARLHRVAVTARRDASRRWACSATLVLLLVLGGSGEAHGQACCAGGSALSPGRLELHEWLLLGLQIGVRKSLGNFDADATFAADPAGSTQWDLRQDAFATVRVARRGQLGALVPLHESYRDGAAHASEFSIGKGDVELHARWDFLHASEVPDLVGVALLARVITPTGTAAEDAAKPLGSDVTGIGATQFDVALALERAQGPWLLNLTSELGQRLSREVAGIETEPGLRWGATLALGYAWTHRATSAFVASVVNETNATVAGRVSPKSGTRSVDLALAGTISPSNDWRLRAALSLQPPIDGFGKNHPANVGLAFTVVRSFW